MLFFPWLIHEIPLASLAALLVYTGFRLASPKEFAKTIDIGREQLGIFVITIVGVLATDLLAGVFIGMFAKALIHLARGVRPGNLLKISYVIDRSTSGTVQVRVLGSAIFSNFIRLKSELATLPPGQTILFDLTETYLIDHTVMEFIEHFRRDYMERGGRCEIHGLEKLTASSTHPLAVRRKLRT